MKYLKRGYHWIDNTVTWTTPHVYWRPDALTRCSTTNSEMSAAAWPEAIRYQTKCRQRTHITQRQWNDIMICWNNATLWMDVRVRLRVWCVVNYMYCVWLGQAKISHFGPQRAFVCRWVRTRFELRVGRSICVFGGRVPTINLSATAWAEPAAHKRTQTSRCRAHKLLNILGHRNTNKHAHQPNR